MKFSGKELRALRKEAGFTQAEIAQHLSISRETVVAIENEHPKTIDALTLEVVNAWWVTCKKFVAESRQLSFKALVLKYFGM